MDRPALRATSRWDLVAGLAVHARVWDTSGGAGYPPLVLVHGLGVSSSYLAPVARLLARHFLVFAPDLPGFGRSAKPPQALSVVELAEALGGWMRATNIERAVLLGNSLGCQVIAALAERRPSAVLCAVLVGPTVDSRARSLPRQLLRALADLPRERLSLWPLVAYDYLTAGLGRCLRTFWAMLDDPIEERLPNIQAPVLIVRGARDPVCPQRWAEELERLLQRGRLVVLAEAAHTPNYSMPGALARVTLPFIAVYAGKQQQVAAGERR